MEKIQVQEIFDRMNGYTEPIEWLELIKNPKVREKFAFELTYYYSDDVDEESKALEEEICKYILDEIKKSDLYAEFASEGLTTNGNFVTFDKIIKSEKNLPIEIAQKYLEQFGSAAITIIIATGDVNFIKECIEDKTLRIEKEQIVELVIATKDTQYIKDFINQRGNLTYLIIDQLVAATSDDDYIVQCLENPPHNCRFNPDNRIRMILAIKDIDLAIKCLKKYLRT